MTEIKKFAEIFRTITFYKNCNLKKRFIHVINFMFKNRITQNFFQTYFLTYGILYYTIVLKPNLAYDVLITRYFSLRTHVL